MTPVSVQVAVGETTTHATVLAPMVLPTAYVVPSTGVSATAPVVLRNTTALLKSALRGVGPGERDLRIPARARGGGDIARRRLSIVTVVPAVSVPSFAVFVPVQEFIFAVTE